MRVSRSDRVHIRGAGGGVVVGGSFVSRVVGALPAPTMSVCCTGVRGRAVLLAVHVLMPSARTGRVVPSVLVAFGGDLGRGTVRSGELRSGRGRSRADGRSDTRDARERNDQRAANTPKCADRLATRCIGACFDLGQFIHDVPPVGRRERTPAVVAEKGVPSTLTE